jgi:aspartyl-tRNA(Asn)/glutamyl-tRNA(Gln) amidotransferase subunit C
LAEIVVTRDLVERLAKAARLNLTPEETGMYAQQLSVILDAFKELDQVDTEGVEPSYHPIELEGALREDEPEKWEWDPLANVADTEDRSIRGPKIK